MDGINYYADGFPLLSKRIRRIHSRFQTWMTLVFTHEMEIVLRPIVAELEISPIMDLPLGTLSLTAHIDSTCTATLGWTGLSPPSKNRSR